MWDVPGPPAETVVAESLNTTTLLRRGFVGNDRVESVDRPIHPVLGCSILGLRRAGLPSLGLRSEVLEGSIEGRRARMTCCWFVPAHQSRLHRNPIPLVWDGLYLYGLRSNGLEPSACHSHLPPKCLHTPFVPCPRGSSLRAHQMFPRLSVAFSRCGF